MKNITEILIFNKTGFEYTNYSNIIKSITPHNHEQFVYGLISGLGHSGKYKTECSDDFDTIYKEFDISLNKEIKLYDIASGENILIKTTKDAELDNPQFWEGYLEYNDMQYALFKLSYEDKVVIITNGKMSILNTTEGYITSKAQKIIGNIVFVENNFGYFNLIKVNVGDEVIINTLSHLIVEVIPEVIVYKEVIEQKEKQLNNLYLEVEKLKKEIATLKLLK